MVIIFVISLLRTKQHNTHKQRMNVQREGLNIRLKSSRSVITSVVSSRLKVIVPGETKVSNLERVLIIDKNVASCQITMYEATLFQIQHAFSHLTSIIDIISDI